MRNLLIHKLSFYINNDLQASLTEKNFFVTNVQSEVRSTNTATNIIEIRGMIENATKNKGKTKNKDNTIQVKNNLYIISSTFHLLQLHENIKAHYEDAFKNYNLFFIGAENENHTFHYYDNSYIKLLMNEVIYYNFHHNKLK